MENSHTERVRVSGRKGWRGARRNRGGAGRVVAAARRSRRYPLVLNQRRNGRPALRKNADRNARDLKCDEPVRGPLIVCGVDAVDCGSLRRGKMRRVGVRLFGRMMVLAGSLAVAVSEWSGDKRSDQRAQDPDNCTTATH
jgi:hypothetical protein